MEEITLKGRDSRDLHLALFEAKGTPKAIIQVVHGMMEHKERYFDFAEYLSLNGYTVLCKDMRGHGKDDNDLGFFAKKKGYELLVDDEKVAYDFIKERFPDSKVILLAHSMGTIISRNVLQERSMDYSKVVLSGYPNYQGAIKIAIALSNCMKLFGKKRKSKMLLSMTLGSFNKAVKNPKTPVDWLSYNEENVNKYMADPLCGFNFTTSAYNDLYHLMNNMHKAKRYKNVNELMPMLLIAGMEDPCVGKEKGKASSINTLKKAGFKNIEVISYEHMRHEILNENEHEKVYQDILNFLDK